MGIETRKRVPESRMARSKAVYRSYSVSSESAAREGAGPGTLPDHVSIVREAGGFTVLASEPGILEVADPSGMILYRKGMAAGVPQSHHPSLRGLCFVTWRSETALVRFNWTQL